MATTLSPAATSSLLPSCVVGRFCAAMPMMARSRCGSMATTRSTLNSEPSAMRTFTSALPAITCRLVAMRPSGPTMNPVPN